MTPCARCGRPLVPLLDLAVAAQRAEDAHRTMRLAVPTALVAGVRLLARSLPCHAGTCLERPEGTS
jgi:hypothetical protein